eukprot:CAMPEP_0206488166 /NCGR_PEP_ID=MMETSP0324_2-20121206/42196_1 /ASSEMBLY_ACC=CAM_ASM_000836 /TAXON_ID=2866 /ORGANISM="Crypthecodinium cohnii, Strain Seligo" /LENGTH=124 /DNA_ID=CAMNT_0053967029 /DNA_START=220 /DNA_END=591 /DNA_ORIENTATION=-
MYQRGSRRNKDENDFLVPKLTRAHEGSYLMRLPPSFVLTRLPHLQHQARGGIDVGTRGQGALDCFKFVSDGAIHEEDVRALLIIERIYTVTHEETAWPIVSTLQASMGISSGFASVAEHADVAA